MKLTLTADEFVSMKEITASLILDSLPEEAAESITESWCNDTGQAIVSRLFDYLFEPGGWEIE